MVELKQERRRREKVEMKRRMRKELAREVEVEMMARMRRWTGVDDGNK